MGAYPGHYGTIVLVHAFIRHYLTTGRKYALIKKHAHNKHVHLLTRLYGNYSRPLWPAEAITWDVKAGNNSPIGGFQIEV